MANEEHLSLLKKGVEVWNQWREENPDIRPDLSGTDLSRADLTDASGPIDHEEVSKNLTM